MHARPARAERVLELVGTDDKFRNLPSRGHWGTRVAGEDGDGGKRRWARGLLFLGDGLAREGEASARKEMTCETEARTD